MSLASSVNIATPHQRKIGNSTSLVHGLLLGAASFLLAEALIPFNVASPTEHDLTLASRLGLVYPPVVGVWLGWVRSSTWHLKWGLAIGLGIGVAYNALIAIEPIGASFCGALIVYPCLCGGVFAVALSANDENWTRHAATRLGKGLVAGFVLGVAYNILLSVVGVIVTGGALLDPMVIPGFPNNWTNFHVSMMWKAGPPAFGAASGMFFPLMRWAIAPIRRRFPAGHCQCCGYNLTGNESGICSECGTKFRDTSLVPEGDQHE